MVTIEKHEERVDNPHNTVIYSSSKEEFVNYGHDAISYYNKRDDEVREYAIEGGKVIIQDDGGLDEYDAEDIVYDTFSKGLHYVSDMRFGGWKHEWIVTVENDDTTVTAEVNFIEIR